MAMSTTMNESDFFLGGSGSMDSFLAAEDHSERAAGAYRPGDRVAFVGSLEALMAYSNPPEPGALGTVARSRTSSGDRVAYAGRVFVRWDNGSFSPTAQEHLERTVGGPTAEYRRVLSSLGDLGDFMRVAGGAEDELVHTATRDLWAVREEDGKVVIERLFDAGGAPLKV